MNFNNDIIRVIDTYIESYHTRANEYVIILNKIRNNPEQAILYTKSKIRSVRYICYCILKDELIDRHYYNTEIDLDIS